MWEKGCKVLIIMCNFAAKFTDPCLGRERYLTKMKALIAVVEFIICQLLGALLLVA